MMHLDLEKPYEKTRDLNDWNSKLTDDWIAVARKMQMAHCQNLQANEKGSRFTKDLFGKIDEMVLMHAFGASAKKGTLYSEIKSNFNSGQNRAAARVRKTILKYGKVTDIKTGEVRVDVQVIAVTLMVVDLLEEAEKKKKDEANKKGNREKTEEQATPGLAQVPVFRVVKPDGSFCFVEQSGRSYSDWNNFLKKNKLPRSKMCYPKNGVYTFKELPEDNKTNKSEETEKRYALDLALSESISCTSWEQFKSGALKVVSYAGLVAGVVAIVAAPFTGGAAPSAYALFASTLSGWVGGICMTVGFVANVDSLIDKASHDESCLAEIGSLAMTLLTLGVAKFNSNMLKNVKSGLDITRTQLVFMTVLNCLKFGVDSIMFISTLTHLVMKVCEHGWKSITAVELIQFSMSAFYFGKSVFAPKTGYGIIKEAQRQYLMVEKAAKITDKGAKQKFGEFVDPKTRFGSDSFTDRMKDDLKGFTCSKDVCDELNKNAALIRNVNGISDLNQFFLEVKDTSTKLEMTDAGNMMVNKELEIHGRKLNEIGETKDGHNQRRRDLLEYTAKHHEGKLNDADYQSKIRDYKYGDDRLFFEIDRKAIQQKFGDMKIDGKLIFENMSVTVADRLWRVVTPLGEKNIESIVDAAKAVANDTKVTDPRQFADVIEFVNFKRGEIAGKSNREEFLKQLKISDGDVLRKTADQWKLLVGCADEVLKTAEKPWGGNTSVAYHYVKHRGDSLPNNAETQGAAGGSPLRSLENMSKDEIKAEMTQYINEGWKNVIHPKNVTNQGHSQDGRTFRISYVIPVNDSTEHKAFTAMNADTRRDEKIASHFRAEKR